MNHIKLLQMYEEAESIANEFIRFAMPGHNSISVEGKYIPKTGIMKIKLVQFCFCLFACSGGAESRVAEKSVCEGGRGKCRRFVEIWFTFPGKNSENGGKSIFSRGKCRKFPADRFTFPHQSKKKMQEIATTESIRMTIIVFPLTVTPPRSR